MSEQFPGAFEAFGIRSALRAEICSVKRCSTFVSMMTFLMNRCQSESQAFAEPSSFA